MPVSQDDSVYVARFTEPRSYFPSVASCQHGIDIMQLSQERAYGQDLWQEKVATAQTASGGIPGIAGIPGAPGAPGAPTSAIVVSPASSS